METHLSQTIDITNESARYDTSVKEMLADKQVLARILKYSLAEFQDDEIEDIIKNMDMPMISQVRMEPGQTNLNKVETTSEEDSIPGEGKVFYDIRFSVFRGTEQIKILINLEAQKTTKESKLGYQLDNRIIYYLGRMVSAQKEVEFTRSNYNDLKHVRSIWICMDSEDDEDSINRICLTQETVYGKEMVLSNLDKVVGVIIRLRKNEKAAESKNILVAMLEELLKKDSVDVKKQKLVEQYGLIMNDETGRRLDVMCNLSEVVMEKGIEKGIERGIEKGELENAKKMFKKCLKRGDSKQEAMDFAEIDQTLADELYEEFLKER